MVTFDPAASPPAPGWEDVLIAAGEAAGDPAAALRMAPQAAALLPAPGSGNTLQLWRGMADLGTIDLTVARTLEPHLDALAILDQARGDGVGPSSGAQRTWGVFAAEGPGTRLEATGGDDAIRLTGRKPWCSLAGILDGALVTAWTSPHSRRLFAVDLHHPGVRVSDVSWAARGLAAVTSIPVDFDAVPATPVGDDGWYLERPGFAWGGIGVAATWWGGAAGLLRTMADAASRREPDQVARMLLGQADAALHAAAAVLGNAARAVDSGSLQGQHAWTSAVRIRHVVHEACETVLRCAAHALGPGPLTGNEEHARRVSDLEVYLRQHGAERDAAVIGDGILSGMDAAWR